MAAQDATAEESDTAEWLELLDGLGEF